MKKFNLNDYMYIQIKQNGWDMLNNTVGKDYIKHCIEPYKVNIENKEWYKLQAHVVFDLFPINYGGTSMINTNVMFDDSDLQNAGIGELK